MNLDSIKKVYFIGIGGIGISALAQLFLSRGIQVLGSDMFETPVTKKLIEKEVKVVFNQKTENITDDIDLVIYTIAIPEDHPELVEARRKKIITKTYPEMLGVVSKDSYTIAISGTHGKTTTTAMIADVLIDAKLKPTVIVGSLISRYGSNFVEGGKKYFVVEACEYRRSFLNINPNILAITNIEEDHLDYYKDLEDIQKAFRSIIEKVPADGYVICNPNDPNVKVVLENTKATIIDYTKMPKIKLKVPGEHNIKNAQVAFAIGENLKISKEDTQKSLENFSGTWRRFEYKGETKTGALIFDDYAHHPQEVTATIKALREKFPEKKAQVIFQPHQFSRTKSFLKDFAKSLSLADQVFIAPIYAAREKDDRSISHQDLVREIQKLGVDAIAFNNFEEIIDDLKEINGQCVIMTMGAGDIYKVGDMLISRE